MAVRPHLTRYASRDVTLLGDLRRPGGVTLAFTERTGGSSSAPFDSLNLGDACGDDDTAVAANRSQLLEALGVGHLIDRLVNPVQVHGSKVLVIRDGADAAVREAQRIAREGLDAVVCGVPDVPVLLCFADCVPVVLVAAGAFAVVHSGWRGTIERIAAKALNELVNLAGCTPEEVLCYVGPHISGPDYEVSQELAEQFAVEFGDEVLCDATHLDLGAAVRASLVAVGVPVESIDDTLPSTASNTDRFFSYRAEQGSCGRHGAIAVLAGECQGEVPTDVRS